MNAKTIIIIGVVCFVSGGIFTAGGLYFSQKDRLELNKAKIDRIENDNTKLRQANLELANDIDSLRKQLITERANNKRLANEIEQFRQGNNRSNELIEELQAIVDGY